MAEKVLYDAFGAEIRVTQRVPDNQAETGRVRDPWAGRTTGELTPEAAASALSGRSQFQKLMLIGARLLDDDHIFACMRNLANAVSRLPIEVLPFDDSATAERDAQELREFLYGIRSLKKLIKYLCFGEFYPLAGAGLPWTKDYRLDDFTNVDPWRWHWDDATNSLRILTTREPARGEELDRRGFVIHSAALEPGPVRRRGLWRKVLWLWLFKMTSWPAWVRFAEKFGDPYIWGFFQKAEDKDSLLEAVLAMDASARGVFPVGTEVKLQEAQRYGTTALYEAIKKAAEEGMTKVIQGHVLNTEAKSGSGTLAGNAAADVSQANKEGVADGLEETLQNDLVVPWCLWHLGAEQVARGELPSVTIKADPPDDQEKKSRVYVSLNEVLAKAGRTIDPDQIEDEYGVRTIDLATGEPAPAREAAKPRRKRRVALGAPRMKRSQDVSRVTAGLVRNAVAEMTETLTAKLEAASSIEEFADAIWEGYGELDPVRLASGLRDATLAGNLIGRGGEE